MKRSYWLIGFIMVLWFVISFVTNIIGPIMPEIIDTYQLSLTMAAFLPFSFFLAYGIMSIPAGIMVEKIGEKRSMLIAFGLNLIGAAAFSFHPSYSMALISLFIIGAGMAMLQVIINPLMRTVGGEENFAFFSVMGQLVFGFASFVSPFVFTYLVKRLSGEVASNGFVDMLQSLVKRNPDLTALYWLFTFIFVLIILVLYFIKIPQVELRADEKTGAYETYMQLLKNKYVIFFFFGIVAYVGTEQALADWMSKFLHTYHGLDPKVEGAKAVGLFWGLMSVGCVVGLVILKLFDAKIVLRWAVLLAAIDFSLALFGPASVSMYAFSMAGFFLSVMYSIVFSMALNSVSSHHGSFSGILCSGIFGGALVPLIVGALGDAFGLRIAMMFVYLTLGYILIVSIYARPLIDNKTMSLKELLSSRGKDAS